MDGTVLHEESEAHSSWCWETCTRWRQRRSCSLYDCPLMRLRSGFKQSPVHFELMITSGAQKADRMLACLCDGLGCFAVGPRLQRLGRGASHFLLKVSNLTRPHTAFPADPRLMLSLFGARVRKRPLNPRKVSLASIRTGFSCSLSPTPDTHRLRKLR